METEALISEVTKRVLSQIDGQKSEVIVRDFTIEKLCGIFSNSSNNDIKILRKAIFNGKKVVIPYEEVELFRYKNTAPKAFYSFFEDKLNILRQSGVIIGNPKDAQSLDISKKIITQRDILPFTKKNIRQISLPERSIITELAREYIAENQIEIIRIRTCEGEKCR